MPALGPPRVLTLIPVLPMFRLIPPGRAIVWRFDVRRVVLRERVVTRRRTVFVRERRTAGFAGLRRRALALVVRRLVVVRAVLRRAGIV